MDGCRCKFLACHEYEVKFFFQLFGDVGGLHVYHKVRDASVSEVDGKLFMRCFVCK